jgi:hypothetical protein
MIRAARRRARLTDARWRAANAQSLPGRLARVKAYVDAMKARFGPNWDAKLEKKEKEATVADKVKTVIKRLNPWAQGGRR